jgi:hypothetical protein
MKEKVFYDDLDKKYDDYDRFDIEMWFDNSNDNQEYVVVGKAERWNIKGKNAYGYINKTFNSILEAIDGATSGCGMCYLKIYESDYGRLFIDIAHHDGHNNFEIREINKKGIDKLYSSDYIDDAIETIANKKGYTRNVKFSKRYY